MTKDISGEPQPPKPAGPRTAWQENHGNLLMGFVAIVLAGGFILIYRQNRRMQQQEADGPVAETTLELNPEETVDVADSGNSVRIGVTGPANNLGSVKIAIYDSESGFNDPANAIATQSVMVVDGEASWVIAVKDLPEQFAVAAYHDENDDGMLNRNRFGIPSERYGFSRNARGLTGPPKFKDALIRRPKAGETIDLSIR